LKKKKLLDTFDTKIKINLLNNQKVIMPFSGVYLTEKDFKRLNNVNILYEAALLLRNDILNIQPQKMPDDIKIKQLLKNV